jgi:molecular chaperone DnaK (HSP70)
MQKISKAVGIDLGTTNSAVGLMNPSDTDVILHRDAENRETTPSCVWRDPSSGEIVVGHKAFARCGTVPTPARSFKTLMGDKKRMDLGDGHSMSPEELSAEVLKEMKRQIEEDARNLSTDEVTYVIDRAIVTVPAYFDQPRVGATQRAAEMAGLKLVDLLHEPVAAASYYCWRTQTRDGVFMVYDLGGGTFDVTILKITAGAPMILGLSGHTKLGGDNIDTAIAEGMLQQLKADKKAGYALDLNMSDPSDKIRFDLLKFLAEGVKKGLSDRTEYVLRDSSTLQDKEGRAVIFNTLFERKQVMEWMKPVIDRSISYCWDALEQAGKNGKIKLSDIDQIILAGGSTHIPAVRDRVRKEFCQLTKEEYMEFHEATAGQDRPIAPLERRARCQAPIYEKVDTIVALGAAIRAAAMGGLHLTDPNATVRVEVKGVAVEDRNTTQVTGNVKALTGISLVDARICLYVPEPEYEKTFVFGEDKYFGPSTFAADDVRDLPGFAKKLKDGNRHIDIWLSAELSPKTKEGLNCHSPQPEQFDDFHTTFVQDLNRIIKVAPIFEEQRFTGIFLRPQTKSLLSKTLQEGELEQLNRLLLEDAYPLELWMNRYFCFTGVPLTTAESQLNFEILNGAGECVAVVARSMRKGVSVGTGIQRTGCLPKAITMDVVRDGAVERKELLPAAISLPATAPFELWHPGNTDKLHFILYQRQRFIKEVVVAVPPSLPKNTRIDLTINVDEFSFITMHGKIGDIPIDATVGAPPPRNLPTRTEAEALERKFNEAVPYLQPGQKMAMNARYQQTLKAYRDALEHNEHASALHEYEELEDLVARVERPVIILHPLKSEFDGRVRELAELIQQARAVLAQEGKSLDKTNDWDDKLAVQRKVGEQAYIDSNKKARKDLADALQQLTDLRKDIFSLVSAQVKLRDLTEAEEAEAGLNRCRKELEYAKHGADASGQQRAKDEAETLDAELANAAALAERDPRAANARLTTIRQQIRRLADSLSVVLPPDGKSRPVDHQ